jgi:hypothetical protein
MPGEDSELMTPDTMNATLGAGQRDAAQQGDGRSRLLPIMSGLTFSTVAVLAALIVWASLT